MKKTKLLTLLALLVMICVVATCALVACKDNETSEIKLSQTTMNLEEGGNGQLTATVTGSDEAISWSAEPADVVSLTRLTDKIYTVKALKIGTATITVTSGKLSATCVVTVSDKEVVTITLNGTAVTSASVDMGKTITLAASSNKGNAITAWTSSNENIAKVENGVVSGLKPGKVTIGAQVTASIKAELELTVNSDGDYEYYELGFSARDDIPSTETNKWFYWNQYGNVTKHNYDNGTVNLEFDDNGGFWYNLQLFYLLTDMDPNQSYKVSCHINSSQGGHITLNGQVIEIAQGEGDYTVYASGFYSITIVIGVEGINDRENKDIVDATMAFSNFRYEKVTALPLATPSFTYNSSTKNLTITDTNASADVDRYVLNLYQNGKCMTGVFVQKNGTITDWNLVASGSYQAKLYALPSDASHIASTESAAQEITVENTAGISYTFNNTPNVSSTPKNGSGADARIQRGIWTYWTEAWVNINGEFKNNKLDVEFSNNQGNWYDTQLFYRHPGLENGKKYTLQLEITSNASGRVMLNNQQFTIEEGIHTYNITFTEGDDYSVQITFGLVNQNEQQDIKAASMSFEIKGVTEATQTQSIATEYRLSPRKRYYL